MAELEPYIVDLLSCKKVKHISGVKHQIISFDWSAILKHMQTKTLNFSAAVSSAAWGNGSRCTSHD